MNKETPSEMSGGGQSLAARQTRESKRRKVPIQLIADALIKAGYTSLDEQAKALGLNRSTAWTIVKTKHKLGRLNAKTTRCILANPDTPIPVRAIIRSILTVEAGEVNKSRPEKV